jgi:two-component system chemotaxis sensor kinase CheA
VFCLESDSNRATTNIVVLRAEDRDFGLIVDQVLDTEEIVVKALDKQLKRLGNYAGATIMGDGHVAMILDVVGLARQAHVLTDISEHHAAAALKAKEGDASKEDLQTLLVFRLDEQSRMALPLSHVDRLEEFAREKVERTSRGAVVQYRGRIMPLIDLAGYFKRGRAELPEILHVIVVSRESESRGFIVERILDIMPGVVPPQNVRRRRGTLGATVIQKKVTDLIDVAAIVEDDERAAIGGAEPAEPAGVS